MFTLNKTVVCLEFSKTYVFCALAQIVGRKVNIIAIDSVPLENGIIEEGIIYDIPHLQEVVKHLITSVSRTQNKIDEAWISIPDNKVLITKFDTIKDRKGIKDEDLHKAIEEKFNYSASKLLLINRAIQELNNKVFYLSNAIRTDHIEPYKELFTPLSIPVESIFPTFQCIYEELKDKFVVPTLLLYPSETGFKFFLADQSGVHLESVWGHNVIEFNDNFDKAVDEVVQYAGHSKEVSLNIRKILLIDNPRFKTDLVDEHLESVKIPHEWISLQEDSNGFNQIQVVILKGLLKVAMASELGRGFLEPQIGERLEEPKAIMSMFRSPVSSNDSSISYFTPVTKATIFKDDESLEKRWNWKVITVSIVLAFAILGGLIYGGTKIAARIKQNTGTSVTSNTTPTPTPTPTTLPTPTINITVTPILSTTPTITTTPITYFTAKDVKVLVENGTTTVGAASKVNSILTRNGFTVDAPTNYSTHNVQTTSVTYKNPASYKLAVQIVGLLESNGYPSAQSSLDVNAPEDILVVLGAK